MENQEGILGKAPSYILEKFNRYVGKDTDEFKWGLDGNNAQKLEVYMSKWGSHINSKVGEAEPS